MDGSLYFTFALVGALAGYIVGDFQRELRIRREVRSNLALAVSRTNGNGDSGSNGNGQPVPDSGANGHSHSNGGTLASFERREARSRAVRGDNYGPRAGAAAAGGNSRRAATASLIGAGRDC